MGHLFLLLLLGLLFPWFCMVAIPKSYYKKYLL